MLKSTLVEMERGRSIADRARRHSDLDRMTQGKKVKVMVALPGHPLWEPHGQVNIFTVDGVTLAHQNIAEDDYPSETIMATLSLAIGATVGFDGIPSAETIDPRERQRRDEYRKNLPNGRW